MSDSPSLIGTHVDDWEITEVIGEGAMGAVYGARQEGRRAAVKVAHQNLISSDSMERFRREAQILTELNNPYVVRCFSAGENERFIYVALEFMAGGALQDYVESKGPLSPAQAVGVMRRVLQGLGAVHAAGVVHRDLKPDNVLIDELGRPKLADFGLARHRDHRKITLVGTILGTADYMSPEQFKGEAVDHRADLYGAGAMLYFLMTGAPPYQGRSSLAVLKQHADSPIPDPAELNPAASPLTGIVRKLMAKDPADRPKDATEALALFEGLSEAPLVGKSPLTPLFGFDPVRRAGQALTGPSKIADAVAILLILPLATLLVDCGLRRGLLGAARHLGGPELLAGLRAQIDIHWAWAVVVVGLLTVLRTYARLRQTQEASK
ncbi:MAG: serine/threonine protein kinase [Planctomycetes bacterium]|nr:serine/threonine protein kinase [Planctomycetota bacterium]